MLDILFRLEDELDYLTSLNVNPIPLWVTTWDSDGSDENAMFVCNLLQAIITESDQESQLKCFLKREDANTVLQARVRLSTKLGPYSPVRYNFDGPLVEFLIGSTAIENLTLKFLIQHVRTYTNLSALLFNYLIRHSHYPDSYVDDGSLIAHLLEHGADPDGPGYTVTPLQIAVDGCNIEDVRMLLNAGANPNYMGNGSQPPTTRFNFLRGKNPLRVCIEREHDDAIDDDVKSECRRVKSLLLKYGAKDVHELRSTHETLDKMRMRDV